MFSRRQFMGLLGSALFAARWQDWEVETPVVTRIREHLETVIGGLNMSLDFRLIDRDHNQQFHIEINASKLQPVASCFKAFIVPYYFLNMPRGAWDFGENSVLHSMAVHSNNGATGVVLENIAQHVQGRDNAIIKFNNFLRSIGLANGLHTWNWEGSPTSGLSDPRYAPSAFNGRVVQVRGQSFQVDNVFSATDLARGHEYIWRGEYFRRDPALTEALQLTRELLSIPSIATGYESPIERVFPPGYIGKDGILPASDIPTGRVVNDAGALTVGSNTYLIAFMSAGESESVALGVLGEIVAQIDVYERATGGITLQELFVNVPN